MSLLIATPEETKMIFSLRANTNRINSGGSTSTETLLEYWTTFRNYLESPLGRSLLNEVTVNSRECHYGCEKEVNEIPLPLSAAKTT